MVLEAAAAAHVMRVVQLACCVLNIGAYGAAVWGVCGVCCCVAAAVAGAKCKAPCAAWCCGCRCSAVVVVVPAVQCPSRKLAHECPVVVIVIVPPCSCACACAIPRLIQAASNVKSQHRARTQRANADAGVPPEPEPG